MGIHGKHRQLVNPTEAIHMANLHYFQFPYMSDNYGVLIHSDSTGETAAIDAGDGTALLNALASES